MSDQYAHGLAADWRQRHAMSTAGKVGGAYSGWKPSEPSKLSLHGLGFTLIIAALAAWLAVCA